MSEWSIILLLCTAAFALYRLFFARGAKLATAMGGRSDFERYFGILLRSDEKAAFLIIETQAGEDFFQFAKSKTGLEMNFPMVSARQRSQADAIRACAVDLGIEPSQVNKNSSSLDYSMGDNPRKIAKNVAAMFERGLAVDVGAGFAFKWHKIDP